MILRQKAISGIRWSALASGVMGGIGMIQLIILARILGPEAIGIMAMAMIMVDFGLRFSDLGLTEAVIQRPNPTRDELSSLYWIMVSFGTLAALVVAGSAPAVSRIFGAEVAAIVPWVALKIWIGGLGTHFKTLLKKRLQLDLIAAADISGSLVGFVVAVTSVLFLDQGIWSLVWGVLANATLQSIIYQVWGWRQPDRPTLHLSLRESRPYIRYGMYRTGASVVSFANSRADQALIGILMGPLALGYYNIAYDIARQPINRVLPVVTRVALPVFSIVQNDRNQLRRGYLKLIGGLAFLLAPIFVGMAAVAPVAIPFFLGAEWTPAILPLQILAFAAVISCITSVSESLVNATGSAEWSLYLQVAFLVLIPPAIFVAAKSGSIAIVSLTLLLVNAATLAAGYALKIRRITGPCLKELGAVAGVPFLLSTAMGGAVFLAIPHTSMMPDAVQLAVLILGGALLYLTMVFLAQREALLENLAFARLRSRVPAVPTAARA